MSFRSPLRGPWLTAALGSVLLVLMTIVAVTGFLSHMAYEPDLRGNAIVPVDADLPLTFGWPTSPTWLYAVTQSLHVNVGLVAVPFLLAKLWSVIPRLFVWPPVRSHAHAIERLSIALLVSSTIFQFATGIVNAQYWYAFHFNFVVAHYYGAIVVVGSLALHVVVKTPVILKAYRDRGYLRPLRDDLAHTRPEPDGDLVEAAPDAPTISRRGLFAFVGGASALLLVGNVGESIGGPWSTFHPRATRRRGSRSAATIYWRSRSTPRGCRSPAWRAGRRRRRGRACGCPSSRAWPACPAPAPRSCARSSPRGCCPRRR